MNYQKKYNDLILEAKSKNRKKYKGIYYENHHIIPKCVGGLNTPENLVLLTAKEHFIAHKLLTYIYPLHEGIVVAFHLMATLKNKYQYDFMVSAKEYAYSKELLHSIPKSERTKERRLEKWFDRNCSVEAINKYLESLKGVSYSPDYDRTIHIPFKNL